MNEHLRRDFYPTDEFEAIIDHIWDEEGDDAFTMYYSGKSDRETKREFVDLCVEAYMNEWYDDKLLTKYDGLPSVPNFEGNWDERCRNCNKMEWLETDGDKVCNNCGGDYYSQQCDVAVEKVHQLAMRWHKLNEVPSSEKVLVTEDPTISEDKRYEMEKQMLRQTGDMRTAPKRKTSIFYEIWKSELRQNVANADVVVKKDNGKTIITLEMNEEDLTFDD